MTPEEIRRLVEGSTDVPAPDIPEGMDPNSPAVEITRVIDWVFRVARLEARKAVDEQPAINRLARLPEEDALRVIAVMVDTMISRRMEEYERRVVPFGTMGTIGPGWAEGFDQFFRGLQRLIHLEIRRDRERRGTCEHCGGAR